MELRRVVVTGLGALTPIGNTVEEYWNGLINGVSGARKGVWVQIPPWSRIKRKSQTK